MANLTEAATFDANIYRLDQSDPVQGWDGSTIGLSNSQGQALANRTQWLKARVDLGMRITNTHLFAPGTPGQVEVLTPDKVTGTHIRCNTAAANGVLTLPLASSVPDGANALISIEPGAGISYQSSAAQFIVLGPSGADQFYDLEGNELVGNYTINPYTTLVIRKLDGTKWFVYKINSSEKCPPGSLMQFAGASQPYGWLTCTGTAVSRTTYAELFAAIGITYGAGNGTTTFNIPTIATTPITVIKF